MLYYKVGTRATTTLLLPTEAASALPFFCATPVMPLNIPSVDWTRSQAYANGDLILQRPHEYLTYYTEREHFYVNWSKQVN